MFHNVADLFDILLESTFYKEMSMFKQKYRVKNIR